MIPAAILFAAAVIWRVLLGTTDNEWLHNFAPLSAIALCGAVWLPRRLAVILPLAALLVSDLVLNAKYGVELISVEMLARYAALVLVVALGCFLRKAPKAAPLIGASVVSSVAFYLITNSASWLTEPLYAKTFGGWVQALTTGLPGYPSTLWFYRNTLLSDVFFTVLMLVCVRVAQRHDEPEVALSQA